MGSRVSRTKKSRSNNKKTTKQLSSTKKRSNKKAKDNKNSEWKDTKWKDLVMWDNITFCYDNLNKTKLSESDLKEIKKTFNMYVNNIAYKGYVSKNRVNMSMNIKKVGSNEIEYNVSAYPKPLPQNFPKYVFSILPKYIYGTNYRLVKKDYHAI